MPRIDPKPSSRHILLAAILTVALCAASALIIIVTPGDPVDDGSASVYYGKSNLAPWPLR